MATSKKATAENTPEDINKEATETEHVPEPKPIAAEKKAEKEVEEKKRLMPKDIDPTQYVIVKNGFQGKLVYISARTHERFVWDSFGDEQEMELRELRNAKGSAKKFFENNWFMFDKDDAWIIDYLGVGRMYKYALDLDGFDEIFSKDPKEITEIISKLSPGQKRSLSYRARDLIKDEVIDSMRVVSALEKALGVELVER